MIVEISLSHYLNHYAMTQKWLYLSEFLGGLRKVFLVEANFLGWLEIGGWHDYFSWFEKVINGLLICVGSDFAGNQRSAIRS